MSNNFWNNGFSTDEETVSEFDLIQDEQEMLDLASEPVLVDASEEELEQVAEESNYDLNDQEANVIYNAKLRLEQAKLYEMLINHNIFQGVDASPEAVTVVENELKLYIVRRLEILLGIRKPVARESQKQSQSDFNSIEVGFLKQLAYKGTLGKSAKAEEGVDNPQPKPLTTKPKQQTLNPIGQRKPSPRKQAASPKKSPAQQPQRKPVRNNPQPKKDQVKLKPSGKGRQLTQEEAMEIAKRDLEETTNRKKWEEMSQKEKQERVREVNEKYKKPRPQSALPFPTASQLEQQYLTRQQLDSASNNQKAQFNNIIANVLMNKK